MYPIMGDGNVDMWHDYMYVHVHSCNIIIVLVAYLQQF